jgi:hypothetical protein
VFGALGALVLLWWVTRTAPQGAPDGGEAAEPTAAQRTAAVSSAR